MADRERRQRKHVQRLGNYADDEAVSCRPPLGAAIQCCRRTRASADCCHRCPLAAGRAGPGVRVGGRGLRCGGGARRSGQSGAAWRRRQARSPAQDRRHCRHAVHPAGWGARSSRLPAAGGQRAQVGTRADGCWWQGRMVDLAVVQASPNYWRSSSLFPCPQHHAVLPRRGQPEHCGGRRRQLGACVAGAGLAHQVGA